MRRALAAAVRRGVDVSVIVPGHSDVKLVEWATLYIMRRLARIGVKMLRWRGVMLHAKTATIDDTWSTIGSSMRGRASRARGARKPSRAPSSREGRG